MKARPFAPMLTVIIDARNDVDRLPALLAQLTAGAVDGLVRQVAIVATDGQSVIADLCEETGAETHLTIEAAAAAARAHWLAVVPAGFRLRDGWIGSLNGHLAGGGQAAIVEGMPANGLFARRPFGVLVERSSLVAGQGADLNRLRRRLGFNPRRAG